MLQSLKDFEERELAITDIKKIVLRKIIQSSSVTTVSARGGRSTSRSVHYQYILVFVSEQNGEMPFDFGKVNAGLVNLIVSPDEKKRRAAEQIAKFIGVELDATMPSAGDVLSALKQGITATLGSAS